MCLRILISSSVLLILMQGAGLARPAWEIGVALHQVSLNSPFSFSSDGWDLGVAVFSDLSPGIGIGASMRVAQTPLHTSGLQIEPDWGAFLGYEGPPGRSVEFALAFRWRPPAGNGPYATGRLGGSILYRGDVYETYTDWSHPGVVFRRRLDYESGVVAGLTMGIGVGYCLPRLGRVLPTFTGEAGVTRVPVLPYTAFRLAFEW